MSWENIETRLAKALTLKSWFPLGLLLLPDAPLDIDDWLVSIAETDEELLELNIPRVQFLHNRWPIQQVARFEWGQRFSFTFRTLWSMHMRDRDYFLLSHGFIYYLIARVQPGSELEMYRVVISRVLHDLRLLPTPPTRIISRFCGGEFDETFRGRSDAALFAPARTEHHYLSDLMVGWIGPWINVPVVGYWHSDDIRPV